MSEHIPLEDFETPNDEAQIPTLDLDAINSIVRAQNNSPDVLGDAKDVLASNSTGIDKFFDSQLEFIQSVAETGVVPDKVIEVQLEELSIALGAMRGMSRSSNEIVEYVESLKGRTQLLVRTVGHLIRRIDSQEDAAKDNLKKINELQDLAEVSKERALRDPKFPDIYNPIGTKIKIIELMQSTERSRSGVTIRYIDYRNFTEVNEILQHDRADKLLEKVGKQLREGDIFGRDGGDEFVSANITPRQEEASSPVADGLGYADRFFTAQYKTTKLFKNELSAKAYTNLQKIMGAKIGIMRITGEEIAACRSNKAKLEELYDRKRSQADAFSTSIAQNIRSAISGSKELSQIAIAYDQPRAIKDKDGNTTTKPHSVCTIVEADTVPNTDTQPFKLLVTILNPERVLSYDKEHFDAEFKTRTDHAGRYIFPDSLDIDLRED